MATGGVGFTGVVRVGGVDPARRRPEESCDLMDVVPRGGGGEGTWEGTWDGFTASLIRCGDVCGDQDTETIRLKLIRSSSLSHTRKFTLTHSLTHVFTHSLSHTRIHSLTLSHTYMLTHSHTRIHSLTQTRTHQHMHARLLT